MQHLDKQLTFRERQVLHLAAAGLTDVEIGHALNIEPGTAKNHIYNIGQKYGTRNRIQSVIWGVAQGDVFILDAIRYIQQQKQWL